MALTQALLYLAAVVLIALAAFGVTARPNLALLGASCFVLAFALPTMDAAF
jgi:hypothetical protein